MSATPARIPEAPVDPLFLERWSPRAFRPDPVPAATLATLFEAARWAPSCFNDQPWLFAYAVLPADRQRILGLLVDANRAWAGAAPVLGVVFARRIFAQNGKPNRWGPFDAGQAAMSLALQAHLRGLASHFMGGFDEDAAYGAFGVPKDRFVAMAAFALGFRGDPETLPGKLRAREHPSSRKPLRDVAFEGTFQGEAPG